MGPKWVRDSLALKSAGTSEAPVDEKAYEVATSIKATLVHAPRRAREHIEQVRLAHTFLVNCHFLLYSQQTPTQPPHINEPSLAKGH